MLDFLTIRYQQLKKHINLEEELFAFFLQLFLTLHKSGFLIFTRLHLYVYLLQVYVTHAVSALVWSILSSVEPAKSLSWSILQFIYIICCCFFLPELLALIWNKDTAMNAHFHFVPLQSTLLACLPISLITVHPGDLGSGGMIKCAQFYIENIVSSRIILLLKVFYLIERCVSHLIKFAGVIRI